MVTDVRYHLEVIGAAVWETRDCRFSYYFFENVCVGTKLIAQASVIKALVDDVIKLFRVLLPDYEIVETDF